MAKVAKTPTRRLVVGGDLEPGREVLGGLEREPLIAGAAEHRSLVPGLVGVDRGVALLQASLVELAGHPAGHHVGRVRPRAAEGDDDREDPLRLLDGLARQAALERRLEELDHPIVERMVGVGRVAEVGRKHEKAVARVAHDRLGHEAEVADARAVGGDRLLVGGLERRGRRVELRRAADPADARRDHQRVGGVAPDEDLLEAAEHRADAPRVGHRVAVELELDLHVALDPVELHPDDASLARHEAASLVSAQALAGAGTRCLKSALGSGNFGPMHP